MKKILTLILILTSLVCCSQTVINMMDPGDATIILLEVDDPFDASIIVYKTNNKKEYKAWDYMWKFKKWGFSNFSIYIAENKDELTVKNMDDELITYEPHATIFFTQNKNQRGYLNVDVRLPGIMRILKK